MKEMAKKRLSNKEMKNIAEERIITLMQRAKCEARVGSYERSRRYVTIVRKVSNKTKTPVPKNEKYCKGCLLPLIPGVNCTVRLKTDYISTRCLNCGKIIRTPYAYKKDD